MSNSEVGAGVDTAVAAPASPKSTFDAMQAARDHYRATERALDAARQVVEKIQQDLETARKAYVESYRVHESVQPPELKKTAIRARAEAVKRVADELGALELIEQVLKMTVAGRCRRCNLFPADCTCK